MLKYLDLPLPDSYEVHFAMDGDTEAIPMIGNADGVEVPNSLLERSGRLAAYLYLHDTENDGETEYVVYGTVRARQKPTGAEPTPEQADVIAQAISALNTAVDEAEAAQASAEAAADAIENLGVTAETLDAGSPATVEKSVDSETGAVTLSFGIPKGAQGNTGATPDIHIGTVATGEPGSDASATMTGMPESPVLNLSIPRGDKGEEGNPGVPPKIDGGIWYVWDNDASSYVSTELPASGTELVRLL